jgi:hypothetical protein
MGDSQNVNLSNYGKILTKKSHMSLDSDNMKNMNVGSIPLSEFPEISEAKFESSSPNPFSCTLVKQSQIQLCNPIEAIITPGVRFSTTLTLSLKHNHIHIY